MPSCHLDQREGSQGKLPWQHGSNGSSRLYWKYKGELLWLTSYQLYLHEYLRQNIAPPNYPILPA